MIMSKTFRKDLHLIDTSGGYDVYGDIHALKNSGETMTNNSPPMPPD